ncbi:hypothetical protein NDU88_003616 [Pleurodeles waltl]|uniref:Uncharacterized protein n=1 Tax=Pleurodeles waltl TaxID=8319 RepID=A0AAV7VEQ2_PLEWA|nr:hypothetical protein NDU88_003616 [Pleurodeles waltl]
MERGSAGWRTSDEASLSSLRAELGLSIFQGPPPAQAQQLPFLIQSDPSGRPEGTMALSCSSPASAQQLPRLGLRSDFSKRKGSLVPRGCPSRHALPQGHFWKRVCFGPRFHMPLHGSLHLIQHAFD